MEHLHGPSTTIGSLGTTISSGYRILIWSTWRLRMWPSVSRIWNDTGPIWSNMVPPSHMHVRNPTKFRTYTQSSIWNALALVCLSCPWLCLAWLSLTFTPVSGCHRSNRNLGCLPKNNSAGDRPVVVVWGVILYLNKNLDNLVSSDPPWIHLIPCLNVWTPLSANPFEVGWYRAVRVWVTPFIFKKSSNSSLVNTAPLSVTILSGRPCVAKMTQFLYGCGRCNGMNRNDIHPLRMGIY